MKNIIPYRILSSDDARILPYKEDLPYDHCWVLVEFDNKNIIKRIVATDNGEPEDQTLARNFSWVANELNNLAAKLVELQVKYDSLLKK